MGEPAKSRKCIPTRKNLPLFVLSRHELILGEAGLPSWFAFGLQQHARITSLAGLEKVAKLSAQGCTALVDVGSLASPQQ